MSSRVPRVGAPDWAGLRVTVAGAGVSGEAAAKALLAHGAVVTVVDAADDPRLHVAGVLEAAGAIVRLGREPTLQPDAELVVTSPGWRPSSVLLLEAVQRGVPVWGEVELAWRFRAPDAPPWLTLTGTNGKTTTVRMLASMLAAATLRTVAAGNVGAPLVEHANGPYDVIAVELSSFQLHWTSTAHSRAAAVLNVAPDHIDWHGSLDAYTAAKGRIYEGCEVACVYNVDDPRTEQLVRDADVAEGCRAVGFTLGVPSIGTVGVVEDLLVDRAFGEDRGRSAVELASIKDVLPYAPHNVANALAAAALARAHGVSPEAVREGLRSFVPDGHRIAHVGDVKGVTYVDDSKATNPHAAAASLATYDKVVWIAGGLAKGATFDDLIEVASERLRAVVLMGADRAVLADALSRHAPDVPVVDVARNDTGAMDEVVTAAAGLARPGDTVLLAPACASMDMFANYSARGDAFAAAVARLER